MTAVRAPAVLQTSYYPDWLHWSLRAEYDEVHDLRRYVDRAIQDVHSRGKEYIAEWDENLSRKFSHLLARNARRAELMRIEAKLADAERALADAASGAAADAARLEVVRLHAQWLAENGVIQDD
jgi:hypothetical protein